MIKILQNYGRAEISTREISLCVKHRLELHSSGGLQGMQFYHCTATTIRYNITSLKSIHCYSGVAKVNSSVDRLN